MLKERIFTALFLLPIVLWCVFGADTSFPFMAFAGVLVLIGAWEWTALMNWQSPLTRGAYVLLVAGAITLAAIPQVIMYSWVLYGISVWFWLMAVRWVIHYPGSAKLWARSLWLAPVGLVLLVPAWSALSWLHQLSPWWLLYLFGLVWGADTGAYFAGRAFGRNKLAPSVSPGKTLEGLAGGLLTTVVLMIAVAMYQHLTLLRSCAFVGLSLLTVLASVLGDLFESMVKRQAGVKDSGNIFPGHGGALDRIDSLTAAAPVFAFGWWLAHGF